MRRFIKNLCVQWSQKIIITGDQMASKLRQFRLQKFSEQPLEVFSFDKFHMFMANDSILIIILNTTGEKMVLSLIVSQMSQFLFFSLVQVSLLQVIYR